MPNVKTLKKTIYGILLVSFFLICFMQGVSSAQTGNVTGTITGPSGVVSGTAVTAYNATTGASVATSPGSGADGSYTISGLPPAIIKWGYRKRSTYAMQYYYNAPYYDAATVVAVTAGATTSSINFNLVSSGSVSGIITRSSDGQTLSGLTVRAYDATTGSYVKTVRHLPVTDHTRFPVSAPAATGSGSPAASPTHCNIITMYPPQARQHW